jgi:hypothetical protein
MSFNQIATAIFLIGLRVHRINPVNCGGNPVPAYESFLTLSLYFAF